MSAASPVYDLSYCIYSGGTRDIFNDLDYYLHVYYKSLSDTLKQFGSNVELIYPFTTFKSEWKHHCKYGYSMALLLLKNKLMYKEAQCIEITEEINVDLEMFEKGKYDKELLDIRAKDLVYHMYVNRFI